MTTPSAAVPDLTGRRILVVDDHQDTLDLAQLVLTQAGASVVTSPSPAGARTQLEAGRFDAVLTDLTFAAGTMAGLQVLEATRALQKGVIIAMTGRGEIEDELRALGFDLVLIKPFDPFALAKAVADALRGR